MRAFRFRRTIKGWLHGYLFYVVNGRYFFLYESAHNESRRLEDELQDEYIPVGESKPVAIIFNGFHVPTWRWLGFFHKYFSGNIIWKSQPE